MPFMFGPTRAINFVSHLLNLVIVMELNSCSVSVP